MLLMDKLGKPPTSSEAHINADYTELVCLFNPDRRVSQSDVLDRFEEEADLDVLLDDFSDETRSGRSPEKDDAKLRQVSDWFRHLEYRRKVFGNFYPFEISTDGKELVGRENSDLTDRQKLYLYLLLASSLQYIVPTAWQKFTASFEFVSAEALRSYMSGTAQVFVFGTNPMDLERRYSGPKFDKIEKLAKDLGERVACKREDFAPTDTQDAGLDIVGWFEFSDEARGRLIVFGQCTCKEEWYGKQFESSLDQWKHYINFISPPANMIFIPYCYRKSTGRWENWTKLAQAIMFDRVRLVNLLERHAQPMEKIPYDTINYILEMRESLF